MLQLIEEFIGKRLSNGQPYIKAFAVAFVKTHIEGDSKYLSYLTASYAKDISSPKIDFKVIRSLELKALEQEYEDMLTVILPTINQ